MQTRLTIFPKFYSKWWLYVSIMSWTCSGKLCVCTASRSSRSNLLLWIECITENLASVNQHQRRFARSKASPPAIFHARSSKRVPDSTRDSRSLPWSQVWDWKFFGTSNRSCLLTYIQKIQVQPRKSQEAQIVASTHVQLSISGPETT